MKRYDTRGIKFGMITEDLNAHFNDNSTREHFLRTHYGGVK